MALDATSVVSGRNFRVYQAPVDDDNDCPVVAQNYSDPGDPFGAGELGLTQGGLNFSMGLQRGEIRADQLFFPVVRPLQSANLQMVANLMELKPANIKLASGMGTPSTTAPGVSTRGKNDLLIDDAFSDEYNAYLFGIQQPDTMPFWILGWNCLAVGSPNPQFTAEGAAITQLTVAPLPDTANSNRLMKLRDVLPPTG